MSLRDAMRRTVRSLHLESSPLVLRLRRFYPRPAEAEELARMLAVHRIDAVLDVGANVGQFARSLRLAGYSGKIVSFEPLEAAHRRLQTLAARDEHWHLAPRVAVGDRDSTATLHVSADTVSSSIAPMLEAHLEAAPDSVYVSSQQVPMRRLDSVAPQFLSPTDRVFLKIDVQGLEGQVLEGSTGLLPQVVGLLLELSLVPCYEGQLLLTRFLQQLEQQGFELWNLVPGTVNPHTRRLLQTDAILFRTGNR